MQVPSATPQVLTWIDAGLVPMRIRVMMRQVTFIWTAIKKRKNPGIHEVIPI